MKKERLLLILLWAARLWGAVVLLISFIAIFQMIQGDRNMVVDYKFIALYTGNVVGLLTAYKWPGAGGIIAVLGIIISGFWHPVIFVPGCLYVAYWIISRRIMQQV